MKNTLVACFWILIVSTILLICGGGNAFNDYREINDVDDLATPGEESGSLP